MPSLAWLYKSFKKELPAPSLSPGNSKLVRVCLFMCCTIAVYTCPSFSLSISLYAVQCVHSHTTKLLKRALTKNICMTSFNAHSDADAEVRDGDGRERSEHRINNFLCFTCCLYIYFFIVRENSQREK